MVEELFTRYRKLSYNDVTDAPWILRHERASLDHLLKACPQRFAPLVRELTDLAEGQTLLHSG